MLKYLLLPLCAFLLFGCDQKKNDISQTPKETTAHLTPLPEITSNPVDLLQEPIKAVRVETPTEAILTWRRYRRQKPVLVIMSNELFLEPVPTSLHAKATDLVLKASEEEFRDKAVYLRSNSILLHRMALSAALDAGLFSKVVWILPTAPDVASLDRDEIIKSLKLSEYASQKELDNFKPAGNNLAGTLKNTPVLLTSLNTLPDIEGPILFHIESRFFRSLYQSEIKTPLYALVYNALKAIQAKGWQVEAVTASSFTLGGNNALSVRFLVNDIARVMKSPEMLASPPPAIWQYRARAFYLSELIQPGKILDAYLEMEKLAPENASIQFALYETSRKLKQGNKALAYLDKAVALDPGYADEYLNLALTAYRKKNIPAADRMLQKAHDADPLNPFILLKAVPIYLSTEQPEKAQSYLERLERMDWSREYDPDIKNQLDSWDKEISRMKQSLKERE